MICPRLRFTPRRYFYLKKNYNLLNRPLFIREKQGNKLDLVVRRDESRPVKILSGHRDTMLKYETIPSCTGRIV